MATAVAKQLVPVNPLAGLAREMRLGRKLKGGKVKAFTAEQLVRFFKTADVGELQDHLFELFDWNRAPKAQQRIVKRLQRAFARVLDRAGLPAHHTMHSLRHSFASIHVSKGVSIVAVQQWLGHASIAPTVDTYGAWLPTEAGVLDLLVVAEGPVCGSRAEEQGHATACLS